MGGKYGALSGSRYLDHISILGLYDPGKLGIKHSVLPAVESNVKIEKSKNMIPGKELLRILKSMNEIEKKREVIMLIYTKKWRAIGQKR